MEAKELRIGNHASIGGMEMVISVEDLYQIQHYNAFYKGIPLTEERLKRLEGWKSKFLISFCWDQGNTAYDGIYITLNGERIKQIYYVHEAQNWHYLTAGSELEIKEKTKQ